MAYNVNSVAKRRLFAYFIKALRHRKRVAVKFGVYKLNKLLGSVVDGVNAARVLALKLVNRAYNVIERGKVNFGIGVKLNAR